MMTGLRGCDKVLSAVALAGVVCCSFPAAAYTHTEPPMHHFASVGHHNAAPGWHGYHHGYGFYGFWPWYFPWAYGYGLPYYGDSFYIDVPVTYIEMAPAAESGAVQPANSWYYCKSPEGYFPYVKTCPSGWQTVPAQPPAPPGPAPAPPEVSTAPPVAPAK